MKKTFSLLCAAVLLICAVSAAAGDLSGDVTVNIRDRFQLRGKLPEGYQFSIMSQSDLIMEGAVTSDDPEKPVMYLSVSFNESYADVDRLNSLSEAELEQIRQGFSEEYSVSFDMAETALGTKLLVVRETGSDRDFLDFYTIFLGHEIELTLYAGDNAPDHAITDGQIGMCIDFLSALELIPIQ